MKGITNTQFLVTAGASLRRLTTNTQRFFQVRIWMPMVDSRISISRVTGAVSIANPCYE
jgi:hypothetical protein